MRLDSHVYEGYTVSPHYDSLLGKLIVWGQGRTEAVARSARALGGFEVAGVTTTIPFYRNLLETPAFRKCELHTRWVEATLEARDDDETS